MDNPGTTRQQVRVLTRGGSTDRQPALSPDGKRVLFSSNRSGNLDVWSMDIQSGALSRLTDDPNNDWDPAFMPDGSRILWTSNRTGQFEVWTAAVDGSGATQLSHTGVDAQNPRLTADGQWILFVRNVPPNDGVWKMRPDGTGAAFVAGNLTMPVPSPDPNLFIAATQAYRKDRSLRVFHLSDGSPLAWEIPLVLRYDLLPGRAQWTGSHRIVYTDTDGGGRSGLTIRDITETSSGMPRALAGFDPLQPTETFDITADGTRGAFGALVFGDHRHGRKCPRNRGSERPALTLTRA